MHATKQLRDESDELEFVGPQCNLRDIDLGIAVGSAAKTAALHSIDARCQTRIAVAARKLGHDVDFDALDTPGTGTLPVGVPGAAREGGARNRQQPRRGRDATRAEPRHQSLSSAVASDDVPADPVSPHSRH
jgi:hypothetical protein